MKEAGLLALVLGLLLIGFGLVYPMVALLRANRRLSQGPLSRLDLVLMLVLSALLPLTAVLAGFWLLSERARGSALYSGALLGAALLLVVALLARWSRQG